MKGRIRGCLIGGAIGDALGYPVEFLSDEAIRRRFGADGITDFVLRDDVAQISDDTQMTLFTATGLLDAATHGSRSEIPLHVGRAYGAWYRTQTERYSPEADVSDVGPATGELLRCPVLYARRAPGTTCLTALSVSEGRDGKDLLTHRLNDSKGCGGVMRVAPVGLFLSPEAWSDEEVARLGAQLAAITHGHPLGFIPAAGLVVLIRKLSVARMPVRVAIDEVMATLRPLFGADAYWSAFEAIVAKSVALAAEATSRTDEERIRKLGGGWVAEEALAIALYCTLRYPDDFERAVVAAVNHSGDSDSTGAITGNLMGARLGLQKIPKRFLDRLELQDVLLKVADALGELRVKS